MSGKSRMTPGPWQASNLWIGKHGNGPYAYPLGTDPDEAAANARAIACLPELVDAARNVLELDRDTFPNYVRGTFAELRRILARIDNGE